MMKATYPFKIKVGAYKAMSTVLNYMFYETVDRVMDGKICRISYTNSKMEILIKKEYHKELANDRIYEVHVLGIESQHFNVLYSLLEPLSDDETVYIDEAGNPLYQE